MKLILIAIRIVGIVYGGFYVAASILAMFGAGSVEIYQPFENYLFDIMMALLYGSLLVPYRLVTNNRMKMVILIVLTLLACWLTYIAVHNSIAFYQGEHWLFAILFCTTCALIALSNLWAYTVITGFPFKKNVAT
jgi:hypothetical protein